jgi:predicted DCC family thiol-disulfide oxidoreductase YuxK
MQHNQLSTLTIYFDGKCPLCLAEIHVLKHNNAQQLLKFVDLHDGVNVGDVINCTRALEVIHAQMENGEIITGANVFKEAYQRSDLIVMQRLFAFKPFQIIYGLFYITFAKFRHQISKLFGPILLKLAKIKYPIN